MIGEVIGFGCMRLSTGQRPDRDQAIALLHAVLDAGATWLDTADAYCLDHQDVGHNEALIREALDSWSGSASAITVATKGGLTRPEGRWQPDGRAQHLMAAAEASAERLGRPIDVYQLHTIDTKTQLETSVRALAALQKLGVIRHVGLCNVRLDHLRRAREICEISVVQNPMSPTDHSSLRGGVVEYCAEHGIRLVAHSPFGGPKRSRHIDKHPVLRTVAKAHSTSTWAATIAWLRSLGDVLPIPGSTNQSHAVAAIQASSMLLSGQELALLDEAFPASRIARSSRESRRPPPDASGDVVVLMGGPASDKSSRIPPFEEAGYGRLNRDLDGGSLASLWPKLDAMLAGGQRRVILDNTYPKRSQRSGVIETAWAHKVPVRCKWVRTSLEQARIHACHRMIQRHGKLLMPEDIRRLSNTDPSAFLPSAHHKYRRELEAPSTDEGFVEVAEIQLETTFDHGTGRAAFFDPAGLDNGTVGHLRTLQAEGYLLLGLGWEPSGSMDIQIDGLQLDIDWCVHPAGPPKCWCRKPLPGLAVAFIERHQLNPAACLWLPHASSDASLAKALGIPLAQPAP